MKKFSMFIVAIVIALIGCQSCEARLFKEAAAIKGVTSIYISPLLLKLGTSISNMDLGHGLDEAILEIKYLEVLTYDEKTEINKVINICDSIISKLGCEIMMEVNEDDECVKIYGTQIGNTTYVNEIIIESYDRSDQDYSLVYIKGKINLSKLDLN